MREFIKIFKTMKILASLMLLFLLADANAQSRLQSKNISIQNQTLTEFISLTNSKTTEVLPAFSANQVDLPILIHNSESLILSNPYAHDGIPQDFSYSQNKTLDTNLQVADIKTFFGDNYISAASNDNPTPLPLPATIVLFGSALTGLIGLSHLRQRYRIFQPYKALDVLGVKFTHLNYDKAIGIFQEWVISKTPHQVCFANVHTVVSCLIDKQLQSISERTFNAMDGLPLVWYTNHVLKRGKAERVCGPDMMLKCLDEGRKRDWKHFFLGSTEPVLNDLVNAMQNRYPGIEIVGWHSPPFRPLTEEEDAQLIEIINASNADFLWVGLGAPKQEKWIAAHLDKIKVPVQLGVGAAFSFHSGHIKRAPVWMQKNGLEWLYRIYKENRLLKRYLETNMVFLLLFARDLLLIRILKLKSV